MKRTWKNFAAKTAAKLLVAALTVTACLSGVTVPVHAAGYGKDGVVRDMTSQQIVEDMGLGYNIGNTFDSLGSFIPKGDPWDYQKGWGNEPVSRHFIQKVKAAGFKTIRFPVSWAQWIDDNHQIDPGYMNAVQTVVDWCMEEDLYVILNMHHDSGAGDTSWVRKAATDWDWTSKRYESVWTQIANNFKNYGDHLIFEGMNEVEFPAAPNMSKQYEILNTMNQLFVDSVRKTGGNNGTRHLLIPGYNTNIERSCDRRYQMPSDPAGHCILSIHYYSPSPFCVAEHDVDWAVPQTSWGTEEDIRAVEADFDILAKNYLSKGIPVIIGEYGVLTEDQKEKSSIQAYVSKVPELILEYGMCPILWDTSNAGDMKFIERVSGDFYDPVIRDNYLALSRKRDAGQITRRQFDYPEYKRMPVQASPEGWVSLAAYQPENILGVAFEMACTSSWDSYGGGGIFLDTWDNTIEYQFNSVYDEIVHIFTEGEKARLKDQLSVAIWWTDESKGGSHRDELSLKNNQVTLLYAADANAPAGGKTVGSGSSGGGSGKSRPDKSTNPSGDRGTVEGVGDRYEYVLKKDRSQVPDTDQETGIQKLDLKTICPDYQAGDKVRLTLSFLSDGGYSVAVTTRYFEEQSASWGPSDGKTVSWECTPSDGMLFVRLWYLGGSYLMFNVEAEVVEKAPRFDGFQVTNGQPVAYSLTKLREQAGIAKGDRIKVTVMAEGENPFSGEASAKDSKGSTVTGIMSNGGTVLVGSFDSDQIEFQVSNAAESGQPEVYNPYKITNIKIEKAEGTALGEFQGAGRIEFASDVIEKTTDETAAEEGLKVYSAYDGKVKDISSNLVVNGDWGYGNDKYEMRSDAEGEYIWYPCESADSVVVACWYVGSPWKITKLVHVGKTSEAGFESFEVARDKPVTYSLAELREQAGIARGDRVKITVSAEGTKAFSGEVLAEDSKGNKVTGIMPNGGTVLVGSFDSDQIEFQVGNAAEEGQPEVYNPYKITNIKIEKAEGTALGEFQGAGRIEFAADMIEKTTDETAAEEGLKVYSAYDGKVKDISSNLIVNGNWGYGNDKYEMRSDAEGEYIWYPCQSADSVIVACWYVGSPWKITKLVHVGKTPEAGFESFEVARDKPVTYNLAELREQAGIARGDRVKITVSAEGTKAFSGEVLAEDSNGNQITGVLSDAGAVVIGNFDSDEIQFVVVNAANDGQEVYNPYTVTDIKIEEAEGTAIGEFHKAGQIEFSNDLVEEKTDEAAAEAGLKVYYEYSDDIDEAKINVIINGDWNYRPGSASEDGENIKTWTTGEDDRGTYIWYPCDSVGSVRLACWYTETPWKITGLVHVRKKAVQEDPEPELAENEVQIDPDENNQYRSPEGKGSPVGMRFIMTGKDPGGANVSVNGTYWGWKSSGGNVDFDENMEVDYVEFFPNDETEVKYVIFIYSDEEEPDEGPNDLGENEIWVKGDEEGKYHNDQEVSPIGMRFTVTGEPPYGVNVSVNGNYWGYKSIGENVRFDENMEVEYVEFFPEEGTEIEYVIFIYPDAETAAFMALDLASITYTKAEIKDILSDKAVHRVSAEREDGICYAPLDIEGDLVGIVGDVSSKEDVIIAFDDDTAVSVTPVDGKVYYFFQDGEGFRSVEFPGETVKNVEFLYRSEETKEEKTALPRTETEKTRKDDIKEEEDISKSEKDDKKEEEKDTSKVQKDDVKEEEKDTSKAQKDDVKEEEKDTSKVQKDDVKEEEKDTSKTQKDDVKEEEKDTSKAQKDDVKKEEKDTSNPAKDDGKEKETVSETEEDDKKEEEDASRTVKDDVVKENLKEENNDISESGKGGTEDEDEEKEKSGRDDDLQAEEDLRKDEQ